MKIMNVVSLFSSAGIGESFLKESGYATFAVGKWHLNPVEEASAAGPFDDWPLQRGFDRYYGFLGGANLNDSPKFIRWSN